MQKDSKKEEKAEARSAGGVGRRGGQGGRARDSGLAIKNRQSGGVYPGTVGVRPDGEFEQMEATEMIFY